MTPSPPTGILLIRFNEGVVFLWLSKRETPEHHLRLASRRSENTVTSFRTFDYDHNLEYRARFQSRLRSIRLDASHLPADMVNRRRIANPPAALRQSIMGIPKTSDNDLSRKGLMTVQAVSRLSTAELSCGLRTHATAFRKNRRECRATAQRVRRTEERSERAHLRECVFGRAQQLFDVVR